MRFIPKPLVIVGVLAVLVLAALLALRARYDVDVPLVDQVVEDEVPVLLVHGYGGGPASMAVLERVLESRGRRVISVALPNGGRGDIAVSAVAVEEIVEEERTKEVDIVGFSAGGLVARTFLEQGGGRVRSLVFLGTPHHGTRLAGLATSLDPSLCARACREMVPGSRFLRTLNSGRNVPPGTSVANIYSADDGVVTPPRSARLEGARNVLIQDVCPGARVAHTRLVSEPIALGLVVDALEAGSGAFNPQSCEDVRRLGLGTAD
jgi:triacylglycerol esterase/lipase EstA (alpha/beta hydrolase family)